MENTIALDPVAKAEMLIRRPVADVYEAFINPAITTKFWFTKSSGRLEPDQQVQWDWEMYNLSVQVSAKEMEPNRRILTWNPPLSMETPLVGVCGRKNLVNFFV